MTYWMLKEWEERGNYEMIVVYANTGKEREETLQFVERCDKDFGFGVVWLETVMQDHGKGASFRIVDFVSASRNGEPFENVISKHGIPNTSFPHCSRELKRSPIRAYAKSLGWKDYKTAIGIRADEPKRFDWVKAEKEKLMYPLALQNPCSRFDVAYFWNRQKFDLEISSYQGNCDLCWKKSRRKILTILTESDSAANWWYKMEKEYGEFVPESRKDTQRMKPPIRFYRGNESIVDLCEEANLPFPKALDESKEENRLLLLRDWNREYDENDGCTESCEVF